jgi:SAM-dependent methyltransferase
MVGASAVSDPVEVAPTALELYRALHSGNPGDVDFYSNAARDAATVLELGAGWGRLALPLGESGAHVTAVEREPAFVALAEAKRSATSTTRFITGDILELELNERFDRVFLGYNVLYALGGRDGVNRAFEVARRHLTANGELWFDVYCMDHFHAAAASGEIPERDDERELVSNVELAGRSYDVWETTKLDLAEQRLDVEYEAEAAGATPIRAPLTHHYLLTSQLRAALENAGLEVALTLGGFDGRPFVEDDSAEGDGSSELFIVCAVPAGP